MKMKRENCPSQSSIAGIVVENAHNVSNFVVQTLYFFSFVSIYTIIMITFGVRVLAFPFFPVLPTRCNTQFPKQFLRIFLPNTCRLFAQMLLGHWDLYFSYFSFLCYLQAALTHIVPSTFCAQNTCCLPAFVGIVGHCVQIVSVPKFVTLFCIWQSSLCRAKRLCQQHLSCCIEQTQPVTAPLRANSINK